MANPGKLTGLPTALATTGLLLAARAALPADVLFVSQFNDGNIVRVDIPSGAQTNIVTGLSSPEDGACSPGGLVYISQSLSGLITRWAQDGTGATNIIPAAGAAGDPEGLTFDDTGNLYFNSRDTGAGADGAWTLLAGDPANPVVQLFPPFTTFGEGSEVVIAGPHQGALLLVDRGAAQVLRSEPIGAALTPIIPASAFPPGVNLYGVSTNGCGEIFVAYADAFGGTSDVYHFDAEGAFLEVYSTPGFLLHANFMEFDSDGNLYVTDTFGDALFKIAPDKTMTLFAAIPGGPGGLAICRDKKVPKCKLTCDAGGPYVGECAGNTTCVDLDGSASNDSSGAPITYSWTSDCPGAVFDDAKKVQPQLCVNTQGIGCSVKCTATLAVSNGSQTEDCTAAVEIDDTTPPTVACELRPALPPASPASPPSPQSPRPPSSPSSGVSSANRVRVDVVCDAKDLCDPNPSVSAKIVLTRHEVENGACVVKTEEVDVACGEQVELVRLAPPCLAKPPRSPRPPLAVSSGIKVLAGEDIRLHVQATDACGLQSLLCEDIATEPGGPLPIPPKPPKCASSLVCN